MINNCSMPLFLLAHKLILVDPDTNILDSLLPWVVSKLPWSFQEIGYRLAIVHNGFGILYMQGIFMRKCVFNILQET